MADFGIIANFGFFAYKSAISYTKTYFNQVQKVLEWILLLN